MSKGNMWQIVFGAIVAVLILAGIAYFVVSKPGPREKITLNVSSDKPTYTAGEKIYLTLQVRNAGEAETCVSDMIAGSSLRFTSFTRDGEPVDTRSAPSDFLISFPKILEASLEPIGAGESVDVTISSSLDPGLGVQALRTTALEDGSGMVTFYNVETPGEYALEMVYEYPGPSRPDCATVFKGSTNIATATFTVTAQ